MPPSLSDADHAQLDDLVRGREIFTLTCSKDTYSDWHNGHIAAFESTPDADQRSWERFAEMSAGDILVAYGTSNKDDYFYGIGMAAGSFDQSVPSVIPELDGDNYQYQIPVDWITVHEGGERIDSVSIPPLPSETVTEIDLSRFDELLAAIELELGEDTPWAKPADEFLSELRELAHSDRLRQITSAALMPLSSQNSDLLDRILSVVRIYLFETDETNPTSERRATALRTVAEQEGVELQQIRQWCLSGVLYPKQFEDADEEQLQEHFDPSLQQIEERWSRYKRETTQATYVVQLNAAYAPDTTCPDIALKAAALANDSVALPEVGGRILFVGDGSCFGKATISETVDKTEDEDGPFFWILVEDYTKFTPIEVSDIEAAAERTFDDEFGCVKLSAAEVQKLPLPPHTPNIIGPDREAIDDLLKDEAKQQALYRESLAHLVAGKNLLFYGPPGTGKTRAADLLTDALCADMTLVTANAEWSNHKVVGGYEPDGGGWAPAQGFLTETVTNCQNTLRRDTSPSWLIIDELNRANLDEAFGEVFTLLDMDYRKSVPINYGGPDVTIPLSFRIIGTMNTYDQAQLFSLGYAFRRRFAFVNVDSLLNETDGLPQSDYPCPTSAKTDEQVDFVLDIMHEQVPAFFEQRSDSIQADVAPIFPEFAAVGTAEATLESLLEDNDLRSSGLDFTEAMAVFARETAKRDVIDIGQALLIDATKFVVAHALLFEDETDWSTVDQAVGAYIIPQFEQFMPALRRAETIEHDSDAVEQFKEVIGLAQELGFTQTSRVLEQALKTKQVLEA